MFGNSYFVTRKVPADVAIPREAIRKGANGQPQVALVDSESKIKLVDVAVGAQSDTTAQITKGLSVGDKVVTLAYGQLRDGATVALPGAKSDGDKQGKAKAGGGKRA